MHDLIQQKTTIEAGLTDSTKEIFESVSKLECIRDLFLCGGTGISIQLNHRLSEDLDFERMSPRRNVTAEDIKDRIKQAIESENLKRKTS